jgi:hypothetical protein
MLRADRSGLLVAALTSAAATAVAAWFFVTITNALALDVFGSPDPLWSASITGVVTFGVVFCGSGSPWFSYVLARIWFALVRRRLPWNLIRFLDLATDDQIVRCTGSLYQFRHARLRSYLAARIRNSRGHRRG